MSSPAQKVSPAPRKIRKRHSRSFLTALTASASSSDISRSKALCASGRLNVIVVIAPSRLTRSLR